MVTNAGSTSVRMHAGHTAIVEVATLDEDANYLIVTAEVQISEEEEEALRPDAK